MTYTAASGGQFGAESASTASFTSHAVGNFVLCEVENDGTAAPTGLSSSNATWTPLTTLFTGTTNAGWTSLMFIGVVTAVSTATVTATFGTGTLSFQGLDGQEFTTTTGTPVLDQTGHIDRASGTTWASLTPTVSGELYFGFAQNNGTAISGSTSGYVYNNNVDAHGNSMAYNLSCAGGVATVPVWGDSGQIFGAMVLVKPAGAATSILPQQTKHRFPAAFTRIAGRNSGAVYSR